MGEIRTVSPVNMRISLHGVQEKLHSGTAAATTCRSSVAKPPGSPSTLRTAIDGTTG